MKTEQEPFGVKGFAALRKKLSQKTVINKVKIDKFEISLKFKNHGKFRIVKKGSKNYAVITVCI